MTAPVIDQTRVTASAIDDESYHAHRERVLELGGEEVREHDGRLLWDDEPDVDGVTYRLEFVEAGCAWSIHAPEAYVRPDELRVEVQS